MGFLNQTGFFTNPDYTPLQLHLPTVALRTFAPTHNFTCPLLYYAKTDFLGLLCWSEVYPILFLGLFSNQFTTPTIAPAYICSRL